ncbi:MAG: hypothetical protein KDA89_07060 [Planctomycetaceae bacterium]|nr:hypothetical protein [Planctomycetaceae bacterium]
MSRMLLIGGLFFVGDCCLRADEAEVIVGGLTADEGGDWDPETSPLQRPFGVDFDSAGNMYIVELEGGRIHRLSPEGTLTQISGDGSKSYRGDGGLLKEATYNGMHNCAVTPDDRLLIADSWNHCVREVSLKTGIIRTISGNGTAGFSGDGMSGDEVTYNYTMCITLTPKSDVLHIADLNNRRIRAMDMRTGIVSTIAGNGSKGVPEDGAAAAESPLTDPRAVAADSQGNVYILERGGNAIRVIRPDGAIHTVAGTGKQGFADGPALQAQFASPKHICVDPDGNVYVADDANKAIRKYDPKSKTVSTILGRGLGDNRIRLLQPHGVCWEKGRLYVLDTSHNRILRI